MTNSTLFLLPLLLAASPVAAEPIKVLRPGPSADVFKFIPTALKLRFKCEVQDEGPGYVTPILATAPFAGYGPKANIVLVMDDGTFAQFPMPSPFPTTPKFPLTFNMRSTAKNCIAIPLNVNLTATPIAP